MRRWAHNPSDHYLTILELISIMKILTECNLAQIISEILNGQIVVFPTETSIQARL